MQIQKVDGGGTLTGFNIENQQGTLFIARFDTEGWYSSSTTFGAYNKAQDIAMAEQGGNTIENLHITFKDR
ncbi:hypothetical protein TAO_0430 [Candidatus Nitrosoglobus terrae]|uniref:Uncharacterized protein n=1 Tax=Candidatus Nitrosoglobus terrae TaxID=1630141 RepID=A0A1Q2SL01_9GAMM|nr:hypothetical protein [Candidatus Nitrosoglobus terrae]BAW79800.1 hypothetical protein TAO_0430 [Candidatus Nitrosoglobus terrae]